LEFWNQEFYDYSGPVEFATGAPKRSKRTDAQRQQETNSSATVRVAAKQLAT